ncbi:iron-sulfur cluster biosynthesis family protein [Mesobacillus foraminis]|uniref:iron-sulfur cluster biosynthesis family protein n=1 Tax=Mesobacillus foraminis TaxID=279826 RepID=UPI000EF44A0E|nr:iron-sulfur cluster biosynthesis family protein [Mesobacillus foraminis]
MQIHFTDQSITRLLTQLNPGSNHLCLIYGIGGCGNPLDGTIRLKFNTIPPANYIKIHTNWIPVYTEHSTFQFLDDNLIIDFHSGQYLVKSNNQIYGYFYNVEQGN